MDSSDSPSPPASPEPRNPAGHRFPSTRWWVLLTAGGSALVAATWLVAQLSWQGRLRALDAEVSFLRRTRDVDLARLVRDLERLAGPAADRLAFQDLQRRHAALTREHKATLEALASLRRGRRLEERFRLPVGASREVLGGKVSLTLEGLEGEGASVSLAGAAASLWRPGDFRELNFGGGRYRLTLEDLPQPPGNAASFRLDALLISEP
ncbi:MAG: hypothetical protein VKO26_01925 [Cyanobacteriota bacterium]|nr:hypothetical protein [Cyanobacteriota bacterium]